MPTTVVARLVRLLEDHGRAVVDDAPRCRALLADLLGDRRREIHLLSTAVESGAVGRLRSAGADVDVVAPQLIRRLQDDFGMAESSARYAVATWARALGMEVAESVDEQADGAGGEVGGTVESDETVESDSEATPDEHSTRWATWWGERAATTRWSTVALGLGLLLIGMLVILDTADGGGNGDPLPALVVLPDVIGQPTLLAAAQLRALGLQPSIDQVVSDEPVGTVVSTLPPVGQMVARGSTVELLVAVADVLRVPPLVGVALVDAQEHLDNLGLSYDVSYERSDAQEGTVIRTDPASGQEIAPDATVAVVVSQAAPQTLRWRIELWTPDNYATRQGGGCVGLRAFYDFDPDETDRPVSLLASSGQDWVALSETPFPTGTVESSRFEQGPEQVCAFQLDFHNVQEAAHYEIVLPWRGDGPPEAYLPGVRTTLDAVVGDDWSIKSYFR